MPLARPRTFLSIVALVGALVPAVLTAGPAWAAPAQPQPIPGGNQIPGGPLIHVFGPGPKSIGGQGLDVEPSTITDFRGFSALAYLVGTATDGDGHTYAMSTDMRVFSGHFVGTDGAVHTGTFAFI
jgi:hypothetical protein